MHIPDGFINAGVSAAAGLAAAGGVVVSLKKASQTMEDKQAPLAGLVAAFVFAVQMLNFPVAAGTSGHLLGGVLATVLVGPWLGVICITLVLMCRPSSRRHPSAPGLNRPTPSSGMGVARSAAIRGVPKQTVVVGASASPRSCRSSGPDAFVVSTLGGVGDVAASQFAAMVASTRSSASVRWHHRARRDTVRAVRPTSHGA
jgi:hypothetical protein